MSNEIAAKQSFSLAPASLSEAMEFAKMMAESEMVPKSFRGKPGDVLIAVQMGSEVGLQPMAAIQNIAVINGKPGIYGDAGKAILQSKGCILDEDDIDLVKKNGRARCKITRPGWPPVERTYSIENAKTAGLWNKEGPWRTNPERQMAWRAFWFAARDVASDLLKGLGGAEELRDYRAAQEINMGAAEVVGQTQSAQPDELPPYPPADFAANLKVWGAAIAAGKARPEQLVSRSSTRYTLSDEQIKAVYDLAKPEHVDQDGVIDADFVREFDGVQQ